MVWQDLPRDLVLQLPPRRCLPWGPQGSRVSLRGWNEEQSLPRGAQENGRVQASKYMLRLPSLQPSRFPSHLFMFWKC